MVYLYNTRCISSCQRGEEDVPSQHVHAYHPRMTMGSDVSWDVHGDHGIPSRGDDVDTLDTVRDECEPWRGRCPMASKRSKKVRNRRKALQRWRQRAATTRRPLSQIPPENADQVAMTTTGELLQLIRLHYEGRG